MIPRLAPLTSPHLPPALRPQDRVVVVAPASPFPASDLSAGLTWLGERYHVELGEHLYERSGYLAGDDASRAGDLARAMRDPDVRAIVCARGGYGILRIVDQLPWAEFAAAPKWICGFSDVTVLLAGAVDHGVAALHAHNLTGLGRADAETRAAFVHALEAPDAAWSWSDLEIVHGGPDRVDGVLFGGNVALIHALAAADRLTIPEGAIVVLEDTTERPYRLDRMMTSLRLGGHLSRAAAIVFGEFTECAPGPDGRTAADVLVECTSGLSVPVVRNAPFGHGAINRPFVLGARAALEGATLTFGSAASR